MKHINARPKLLRLAAHFVYCYEPVVNVKDCVLQSLGHDRSGGLLKFQNEMRVRGAFGSAKVRRETKEQHLAQIIEDRLVHSRVAALGRGDCALDNLSIFIVHRLIGLEISAINRKAGDGLAQRARQRLEREIAIPSVLLGKPVEHVPQNIDIFARASFITCSFFAYSRWPKGTE